VHLHAVPFESDGSEHAVRLVPANVRQTARQLAARHDPAEPPTGAMATIAVQSCPSVQLSTAAIVASSAHAASTSAVHFWARHAPHADVMPAKRQ
jgi:hypothetical protein